MKCTAVVCAFYFMLTLLANAPSGSLVPTNFLAYKEWGWAKHHSYYKHYYEYPPYYPTYINNRYYMYQPPYDRYYYYQDPYNYYYDSFNGVYIRYGF
jgi:hypothetical protein